MLNKLINILGDENVFENEPMSMHTTFRIGGPARYFAIVNSEEDLIKTIKLVKERRPDIKVVVGGAVLTPEFAEKIGADFYSRDAKQTVDIARIVYSE